MEIAKFVLTSIGTFISVLALSFTVFQYWKKKQDEKFDALKSSIKSEVHTERAERKEIIERLERKIEQLEHVVIHTFEQRLSSIEGELKGFRGTLGKIEEWFIKNTPTGGR